MRAREDKDLFGRCWHIRETISSILRQPCMANGQARQGKNDGRWATRAACGLNDQIKPKLALKFLNQDDPDAGQTERKRGRFSACGCVERQSPLRDTDIVPSQHHTFRIYFPLHRNLRRPANPLLRHCTGSLSIHGTGVSKGVGYVSFAIM